MTLLKSIGPLLLLAAAVCLVSAGCSSPAVKTSPSALDILTHPFSAMKKPQRSNRPDTIPDADDINYTPNAK